MSNIQRKLVTVRTIDAVNPILGADAIEVATIGGWNVVVKKNEVKVGDKVAYFEIDSFLPDGNTAWQFLVDKQGREFEGQRGHRLRTVKLRGQISQGFVVPLNALPQITDPQEGVDYAELLGVKKWEAPLPAELAGQVEGLFPSFLRKTDQERCQNLVNEIFTDNSSSHYEVTLKLDGSSCTIFHNSGEFGVCSRNYQLKINNANKDNTFIRIAHDTCLNVDLPKMGNFAVQGELMGPGINGNREQLKHHQLYIFDVFNIDEQRYLTPKEREQFCNQLFNKSMNGCGRMFHVPVIANSATLTELGITNIKELLDFADGPSMVHPVREGLVFKRVDGNFSFKAISNAYLSKEKD